MTAEPITDETVASLWGLAECLELDLRNTEVSDAGLVHLRQLTKLRFLYLSDTNVTEEGVAMLQKALPDCEIGIERGTHLGDQAH